MNKIYDPFLLGVGGYRGAEAVAGVYQPLSGKDVAGGYAGLDGSGKIAASQMPSISLSEYLGNFADLTAALLDSGVQASQEGDWLTTDEDGGSTYIVITTPPTIAGDFSKLRTPTDSVSSVFGRSGAVTAQTNDYTWAQINKTISSLADITTRSAGALSSGNLAVERMPLGGDWTITSALLVKDATYNYLKFDSGIIDGNFIYMDSTSLAFGYGANRTFTGGANTIVGTYYLVNNLSTGYDNTAIGFQALRNITTGFSNVAVGSNAAATRSLASSENVAIGSLTLNGVSPISGNTGSYNTTVGHSSLYKVSTGEYNVGLGYKCGYEIQTGSRNILIGNSCAYNQIESTSDLLMIHNRLEASSAAELTSAIIYGFMDNDPTLQTLVFNAKTKVSETLEVLKNLSLSSGMILSNDKYIYQTLADDGLRAILGYNTSNVCLIGASVNSGSIPSTLRFRVDEVSTVEFSTTAFTFNVGNGDKDFIIKADDGSDAYKYAAGALVHTFTDDVTFSEMAGLANSILLTDANGKLVDSTATITTGPTGGSVLNLQEYTTDPIVGARVAGDVWFLITGGQTFLKRWNGSTLKSVELT